MTAKLTGSLRAAPATVPAMAALILFVVWAGDQAGYPVTHWGPGGVIVLALLAIAAAMLRPRVGDMPPAVRVALAAMAAYTALSFLSILWASVPGDAWEGADRTLLYLLVFALFASWPQRGTTAALLLGAWTLALIGLAAFAALHLDAAGAGKLHLLVPDGRLTYPTGYPNANAAQWLMAFWPAVLLARSPRLHWALRGLLAGGAVLLAEVALLSQSRGSLYVTPVMLILVFVLLPRRVRTFAMLVPVAAGIAAAAPAVLRVGDHLVAGQVVPANVHSAVTAAFLAGLAVAIVVASAAAIETRRAISPAAHRRARTAVAGVAVVALVLAVAGGLAVAGNPVHRLEDAWHSFKGGYSTEGSTSNRLVSGLGSNRYDFYRVALNEFAAHPLAGIGADNFSQQYLLHGRSNETPHYPHSVELRTLSQTGAIGGLIAIVGLAGALLAAWRAMRGRDELAGVVAAAALAGFGYWAIHGSLDWFWEFAGLGAPAFAMLGLACALSPARRERDATGVEPADPADAAASRIGPPGPIRPRGLALGAGAVVALILAASLALPWLSELQVQRAAHIWTSSRQAAYSDLDEAASMNPLSAQPYLVAGSIALRYGEVERADRQFALALGRSPEDAYATLERGAIASSRGESARARSLLARAVRLDPRDELAGAALRLARDGKRVSLTELNEAILRKAQQLA
ncbi:MAG TPA: O-antigen ligase family protein [Solirubrobacteraceae bacterium]|jgi:predicted secreted protein